MEINVRVTVKEMQIKHISSHSRVMIIHEWPWELNIESIVTGQIITTEDFFNIGVYSHGCLFRIRIIPSFFLGVLFLDT